LDVFKPSHGFYIGVEVGWHLLALMLILKKAPSFIYN